MANGKFQRYYYKSSGNTIHPVRLGFLWRQYLRNKKLLAKYNHNNRVQLGHNGYKAINEYVTRNFKIYGIINKDIADDLTRAGFSWMATNQGFDFWCDTAKDFRDKVLASEFARLAKK